MLTAIHNSSRTKVLARTVEKAQGPFACPSCGKPVILNKGRIRVHHFKHESSAICPRGTGESEEHFRCKSAIYDALSIHPEVAQIELEKDLGESIADVYAVIRGVPVAIEVQKSVLSQEEIGRRTGNYDRLGVFVLWIGLGAGPLPPVYRPKAWERWCHAAYLGRVYYWFTGSKLHAWHFAKHATFVESKTLFGPGGSERYVGGYERTHKAEKKPVYGSVVDIASDFRPLIQTGYTTKTLTVPERKIYIDRNNVWW